MNQNDEFFFIPTNQFSVFLVWLLKFKYNDESIFFMLLVEKKNLGNIIKPNPK